MYLELLDQNKNKAKKKQNKTKNHDHVQKQKKYKKRLRDVRSTWLDHMASEGIHLQTLTLAFLLIFLYFFRVFQIIRHLSKGKKYFTVHSGFLLLPNMSCIFPNRSFF